MAESQHTAADETSCGNTFLINLRGKNAYQPDSQFWTEPLHSALTTRLHLKAAARLIFHNPTAFLEMTKFGFSKAGFYPRLLYPSLSDPPEITFRFRWCLWSRLHDRFLNGISYYTTVLFLTLILGTLVWKRKDSGWPLFYLLTATGFFPASLLQVLIAIMGNGPLDIVKHLYFGNLLLDGAFIFVVCGLTSVVITFWKERKTGVKDMRSKDRCTDVKIPNRPLVQDVKSGRLKTFCLCLFALFIYLLVIFKIGTRPFSDFQFYYEVALGILRGEPISSFYKYFSSPGYPYLLALFFHLFKTNSILVPQFVNAFMLTLLLWISLQYPFTRSGTGGFIGYLILAFNVNYLSMIPVLCSEIPYVFFFLIGLFFFWRGFKAVSGDGFGKGESFLPFLASGLFLGVSQYIRPLTFTYLLIFSLIMVFGLRYFALEKRVVGWKTVFSISVRSLGSTWISFFVVAVMFYWMSGYGCTYMPSQKGFWNLYVGFNTESKGMYTPVDASLILKLGNEYNWNAGKINVAFRPIVFNRIRKNWLENLRMLPEKVYNLMDPRGIPYFAIEQSRVKNKDMIYRITGHLSYLNLLALIVSIGAWFTCIAKKEVSNKEFFAFCMTLAGFLYLLLHGYLLEVQSRYSNHLWMMIFWCYPVSQQVVWDNFIKKISWRT